MSLTADLLHWAPELWLSAGALLLLIVSVPAPAMTSRGGPGAARGASRLAALVFWGTWGVAAGSLWSVQLLPYGPAFSNLILLDSLSTLFRWITLGSVGLVGLMMMRTDDIEPAWRGEALGLLLMVGVGMMLMAEANHLLMAYLSMELVSLGSYCLVGLSRDARASEAALKYFLFGALVSGLMLFGMSLLFGATRTLGFSQMWIALARLDASTARVCVLAAAFLLAGLAFKISMVPFHLWTPDAYEGAPVAVTALLSVGPKAAGFALILRMMEALGPMWELLAPAVIVLTVLTMTLGNVVAVSQRNIKRMLAYSTIGQAGYLLIGFVVNSDVGLEALLVYLVAYLFMNLGAFACVQAVCQEPAPAGEEPARQALGGESLEAFRGLSKRAPALAAALALFLLSLAGIPPLVGFVGKFLLFGAAIEAHHPLLALAAVAASAVALAYYVNIIRLMYVADAQEQAPLAVAFPIRMAVAVCVLATVGLGVWPHVLLEWLSRLA